jgi:hypothetical protein
VSLLPHGTPRWDNKVLSETRKGFHPVVWTTQFGTPHPGAGFVGFWWVTPCLHQETMNKCQSCCTKREAVPRCLDVLLECREKTKHIYLHSQLPGPNQLLKPGIDKRFLECSVPWQLPKLQGFYMFLPHFSSFLGHIEWGFLPAACSSKDRLKKLNRRFEVSGQNKLCNVNPGLINVYGCLLGRLPFMYHIKWLFGGYPSTPLLKNNLWIVRASGGLSHN